MAARRKMSKFNWGMKACGVLLLWAAAAVALPAQTTASAQPAPKFTSLHSFDYTDGFLSYAGLIQGTNGNFYGTTNWGGANACGGGGCGTIFRITPGDTLATLHNFEGGDGEHLDAGLVQGANGDFYGTTQGGGIPICPSFGCGTIFKITENGTLITLHRFTGTDGAYPVAVLVQTTDGNFYGTTQGGGSSNACTDGCGTVFKITADGVLTTLHSFDYTDGSLPLGLVQAADGNFYGTTFGGGSSGCGSFGCGTIFKIAANGTLTMLYAFNATDGNQPFAGLVQGTDGNLYGTTTAGGANFAGTVFKIAPDGVLTTIYSFCSQGGYNCTDGDYPRAGLIQATDGRLYGTTRDGGANGNGTVFKITRSGTLTTLHNFDGTDGAGVAAGVVQGTNGTFYGTTPGGGANGYGTVFSLSVGLGPFVETEPTAGKVGKAVKILGNNLTSATSITFNGTAATFKVKSQSEITTTVPTGATTGKVRVTFPHGTRSSNVPFRVN
jgi:uncharacterized repeat protein (TIGR03803 family)